MAESRQSVLPLNPLLFWQVCFLCLGSGILATVWFVEALTFFLIILVLDSRFYPLNLQLLSFNFSIYPQSNFCKIHNEQGCFADYVNNLNYAVVSNERQSYANRYCCKLKYLINTVYYTYAKLIVFIRTMANTTIICANIGLVCLRLGLAICSFILGFAIAYYCMPEIPATAPQWTITDSGKAKYIRWQGTVERVQYLPDKRLRIVFNNVQPVDKIIQKNNGLAGNKNLDKLKSLNEDNSLDKGKTVNENNGLDGNKSLAASKSLAANNGLANGKIINKNRDLADNNILQGKLIWTWQNASTAPLVGERWELSAKIHKAQSFMNFGLSNISFIYHAQSIFWRAYSFENRGKPQKVSNSPKAGMLELLRNNLHNKFFKALLASASLGDNAEDIKTTQGLDAKEDIEIKQDSVAKQNIKNIQSLEDKEDIASKQKLAFNQGLEANNFSNNYAFAGINNLSQAQATLPALLFGDRRALDTSTFNVLSRASLIHSLAISGQHLAVTVLFASLIIHVVSFICPNMFLFLPRTKYVILLALPLAAIYLWLGGAPASLQRATCMMFIVAFFLLGNKSIISIDILIIAVSCLVILWPFSIFELGLQLSALCVATIILITPLLQKISYKYKSNTGRRKYPFLITVLQIAIISLSIQVVMAPFLLLIFGSVSPWFFLNIIWLPILGIFVLPLTVLALILLILDFNLLASYALKFASIPCEYLINFLNYLDKIGLLQDHIFLRPHWLALLGFAILFVALAMTFERKILPKSLHRFIIIGVILICSATFVRYADALDARVKIIMLDVGQGQSILIDAYGGEKTLIDGGGFYSSRFDVGQGIVSKVLTYNARPSVASIINSHADIDHFKGLLYIVEYFGFDSYFYSMLPEQERYVSELIENTKGKQLKQLVYGDEIILAEKPNKLILEVLYPFREDLENNSLKKYNKKSKQTYKNNRSLVLRLVEERMDNGKITKHGLALIMGDLENAGIGHLLSLNIDLQADILVVPHHGSKNSYNPELYKAINPKIALMSYSISNNFGFPSLEIINALKKDKVDIYTTAQHGSVEIIFKEGKYIVRTRKGNLKKTK